MSLNCLVIFTVLLLPCSSRASSFRTHSLLQSVGNFGSDPDEDPCTVLSKIIHSNLPILPSALKSCFKSFPFSSNRSVVILNTLWKVLVDIYPYTNIAINSPTKKIPLNVNLRKIFSEMKVKNFSSDFHFHKELSEAVSSLRDGHTRWKPECYTKSNVLTAFPILKVFDSRANKSKIMIAPEFAFKWIREGHHFGAALEHTEKHLNAKLEDFAGAEILKINAINALEYVYNFAEGVGDFRDQQSRINSLFFRSSLKRGDYFPGRLTKLPDFFLDSDFVNYTLIRMNETEPITISVPYLVLFKGFKFSNSESYFSRNCLPSNKHSPSPNKRKGRERKDLESSPDDDPVELPLFSHSSFKIAHNGAAGLTVLSNISDDIQVYLLSDNITAVMAISDFFGKAKRSQSSEVKASMLFLEQMLLSYRIIRDSGAKQLIIDVCNNYGGFASMGSFFAELLFPEAGDQQYFMQLRASEFSVHAYERATFRKDKMLVSEFDYGAWRDVKSREFFSKPADFFVPLTAVHQNGFTANFSSPFLDKCYVDIIGKFDSSTLPTVNLFNASKVLVLTNGLCFSTCAIFAYSLRQRHGVRFVSVGGDDSGEPFAIASGAVGFVASDFKTFYEMDVLNLGLENESFSPPPLPVKGRLKWAMAQLIGPNSPTIPLEFVYEPGQFKLPYTEETMLSLPKLWQQASSFFDTS